jgi:Uma2 family endonuclease
MGVYRLGLRLGSWLASHAGGLLIRERRYRIPDVTVFSAGAPYEKVVVTPPLLCIEILSPSDNLNQLWDRTQDYFSIGVPVCWLVDPESRRGWIATPAGMVEAKDGILCAGEIEMPLAEVLEAAA